MDKGFDMSQFLRSGLNKAKMEELNELVQDVKRHVNRDLQDAPPERLQWRTRDGGSWCEAHFTDYWVQQFRYQLEWMSEMARKPTTKKAKPNLEYKFVRCELTSDLKANAKIWFEKNEKTLASFLHDVMAEEYKFTCSFSNEHDTFTACLVGKPDSLNEGLTLTARHKDWWVAASTVLFKHMVIFDGKSWESEDDIEADGWA